MSQLNQLKSKLKRGSVYRRADLTRLSNSIDRHLSELIADGTLKKLAPGLYHYPKQSVFGATPPDEETLIRSYLKDGRFLITSPNAYNGLGVGTTQLHNAKIVYNHKRHGEVKLGNRSFMFQVKPHFPKTLTPEFVLVDLVNNIDRLAEDNPAILDNALEKARHMDAGKLKRMINHYANSRTKKLFEMNNSSLSYAS